MKKNIFCLSGLLLFCLLSSCHQPCCKPSAGLIADGATLQEISTEFKFTEGPAADAAGNVYFTDQQMTGFWCTQSTAV